MAKTPSSFPEALFFRTISQGWAKFHDVPEQIPCWKGIFEPKEAVPDFQTPAFAETLKKTLEEKSISLPNREKWESYAKILPDIICGRQALEKGEFEKAKKSFFKALESAPQNPAVHFSLGEVFKALGDFEEAKNFYEKAARLSPESGLGEIALGRLWEEQGETSEAARAYRRAWRVHPNHPFLVERLVALKELFFLPEEKTFLFREEYAERLRRERGRLAEKKALEEFARKAQNLGFWEEAQEAWEAVHLLDPDNSEPLAALGWIAFHQNLLEESERWFWEGRQRFPDEKAFVIGLAKVWMAQERFFEALEELESCLQNAPEHREALELWEACCRQVGESEKGRDFLRRCAGASPQSSAALEVLAESLWEEGKPSDALETWEEALRRSPDRKPLRLLFAGRLVESGDPDKALRVLNEEKEWDFSFAVVAASAQIQKGEKNRAKELLTPYVRGEKGKTLTFPEQHFAKELWRRWGFSEEKENA